MFKETSRQRETSCLKPQKDTSKLCTAGTGFRLANNIPMITDTTIAGLQLQDPNVCPLDIVESHPTVVAGGTTAVDTVKFEDLGQENPVLENFFGPVHPVFGSDQSNGFNYF